MEPYDRINHLKSLYAKRKAQTVEKVDQVIKRLIRANESINFNSVAQEAGVSKASLYNHAEIREQIETLRQQQATVPTPKQVKREMNDANKDALIESLRRRVKALEKENKELREQLKVYYAKLYISTDL